MKLKIRVKFKNGKVGYYEGLLHHMDMHTADDRHAFKGYWPEEDIEHLLDYARTNFFRGVNSVKTYLSRVAESHGAMIEIKEEGEAMTFPNDGRLY